jgi:hypothetical protein
MSALQASSRVMPNGMVRVGSCAPERLQHTSYYTSHLVYTNLTFWGWAFLIWGVLQILAGAVTLSRNAWGAYLGVGLAATSAILWFFMIFAAPFAAILGVTVSLLVVGGFTAGMHPDEY